MQVSQMSDAVTHAVLGKQSSVEMGVSDSAALMHIFSTTLYTYPKLATVREIICNGWDGHITGGCTDIPLQIIINDEHIVIRDFGPGIPHEKIGPIYGVFGNSTKREDGTVTGGFGLGSKAPFSYTDNFEVVSNNGGIKSVYRVSKSSMEKGGKPSIDTMVQVPTEETGIRVTIPLKSRQDAETFMRHIVEVLVLGEIRAVINGKDREVAVLPMSESPTGYVISSFSGTLTSKINLRYGNVVYPVPRMDAYGEMWDQVLRNMNQLWDSANITFKAEPDTISIAPSREALIFTDATVESIRLLLAKFNPSHAKTSPIMTRQLNRYQANTIIREEKPAYRPDALNQQIRLPAIEGTSLQHESGPYAFQLRKAAINHAISQRSLVLQGNDFILKRAHRYVHMQPGVDKVVGKRFLKAARQYHAAQSGRTNPGFTLGRHGVPIDQILQAPLMKYITSPLLAAVRANPVMNLELLSYVDQSYKNSANIKFVNPLRKEVGGIEYLMAFLFKRVLLARSKAAIKQFFDRQRYMHNEQMQEGWVVYQLPTSDKNHAAIAKTFEDLGYEVHTYIPARAAREVAFQGDTDFAPAPRKATPKRKGYLTLHSSADYDGKFLVTTARENCKPEDHITDPIAYVVLNNNSGDPERFADFSEKSAQQVYKMWGKQIAVVTTNQVEKLQAKGIPEVSKYVHQYVDDKLSAAPDFPRYLAFARQIKQPRDYPEGRDGILRYMLSHTDLIASLGFKFRFGLTVETEALVTFFEDDSYHGSRKKLKKCLEKAEKVPLSPMLKQLRDRMSASAWQPFVNMDAIGGALKARVPGDEKLAIPYEIVRNLLKEPEQ
jgi:hypothetical protein